MAEGLLQAEQTERTCHTWRIKKKRRLAKEWQVCAMDVYTLELYTKLLSVNLGVLQLQMQSKHLLLPIQCGMKEDCATWSPNKIWDIKQSTLWPTVVPILPEEVVSTHYTPCNMSTYITAIIAGQYINIGWWITIYLIIKKKHKKNTYQIFSWGSQIITIRSKEIWIYSHWRRWNFDTVLFKMLNTINRLPGPVLNLIPSRTERYKKKILANPQI